MVTGGGGSTRVAEAEKRRCPRHIEGVHRDVTAAGFAHARDADRDRVIRTPQARGENTDSGEAAGALGPAVFTVDGGRRR